MIFGFNTDLRVGENVFHVQTEDRGLDNPVIDTTVYCRGRVVFRRVAGYEDLVPSLEFAPDRLRERLELQHRSVIEELRTGNLKLENIPEPKRSRRSRIQVQLTNPASWLSSGTASLKLEVRSRMSGDPVGDAQVHVTVSGGQEPKSFSGKTDIHGRAELSFPLPRLGGGSIELLIRASHENSSDELRYSLKPRQ